MLSWDILEEVGTKNWFFEKFLSTSNRLDFFSLLVFLMGKWRHPETKKTNPQIKIIKYS